MELEENERGRLREELLTGLAPVIGPSAVGSVTWRRHSNDVGRVELEDGRILMVKVGRFDWVAPRFAAERRAARWLRRRGIVAPEHLGCPDRILGRPVLCYWRIQLHTLSTVWPTRERRTRRAALRDWGALLRRVHGVPVDRCGPLGTNGAGCARVADFVGADLRDRLRIAVGGVWPDGLAPLDAAVEALPELDARVGDSPRVLLHGDPHAGNVMCRAAADPAAPVRCEGLIDLETAAGGPAELDLAHALVLHGPLFAQQLPDGWFDELRRGYGANPDPFAMRWFAVYHLLNLGFYSALIGDREHAAAVAAAPAAGARGLEAEA